MRLLEMAYERAAANKSLSHLFQLSFESLTSTLSNASTTADKELSLALDPSSKECKKWAWLGDAFLSNELSRLIYEQEQEASIEQLHQSRERYKTNEALALYLERAASDAYQIIQERSLSMGSLTPFNKHSVATCFEALLHLTIKRNGEAAGRNAVKKLMQWVDTEGVKLIPERVYIRVTTSVSLGDNNQRTEDDEEQEIELFSSSMNSLTFNTNDGSSPSSLSLLKTKTKLKEATREVAKQYREDQEARRLIHQRQEEVLQRLQLQLQGRHGPELIKVTVRSRKHHYVVNYLRCCGMSETEAKSNPVCGRSKWNSPMYEHSGMLLVESSKRMGGCLAPQGSCSDHVPKIREPKWSCCNGGPKSEGCRMGLTSRKAVTRPTLFDDDLFS